MPVETDDESLQEFVGVIDRQPVQRPKVTYSTLALDDGRKLTLVGFTSRAAGEILGRMDKGTRVNVKGRIKTNERNGQPEIVLSYVRSDDLDYVNLTEPIAITTTTTTTTKQSAEDLRAEVDACLRSPSTAPTRASCNVCHVYLDENGKHITGRCAGDIKY